MELESEQTKNNRQFDFQESVKASLAETNTGNGFEIALSVNDIYKVFGKQKKTRKWWPWKTKNGKDDNQGADEDTGRTVAVDHISFAVSKGEVFGVLGPNGSGKPTLIRLIAMLLILDDGYISVFDHDVNNEPMAVKRLINRVPVEASFFKKLSPIENLLYGARLYGVSGKEIRIPGRSPRGRSNSRALGLYLANIAAGSNCSSCWSENLRHG